MGKHLDLNDRITIQSGLKEGKNFTEIAAELGRDKSTISREVHLRKTFVNYKNVGTFQTKKYVFTQIQLQY